MKTNNNNQNPTCTVRPALTTKKEQKSGFSGGVLVATPMTRTDETVITHGHGMDGLHGMNGLDSKLSELLATYRRPNKPARVSLVKHRYSNMNT